MYTQWLGVCRRGWALRGDARKRCRRAREKALVLVLVEPVLLQGVAVARAASEAVAGAEAEGMAAHRRR